MAQGNRHGRRGRYRAGRRLDQGERPDRALDAWHRRRMPRATLVQNYSAALMRQEQGDPTGADLRLLQLPVPAVQARLPQPS